MARKLQNILVTGGSGFIGSNFIHYLFGLSTSGDKAFTDANFTGIVVNVDCLTYAGNKENLTDIENEFGSSAVATKKIQQQRYFFENVDICNKNEIERILKQYNIDTIIHFAAESHVDRSITGPEAFIKTNVMGTFTLLDTAREYWTVGNQNRTVTNNTTKIRDDVLFHHISTDEVYGSLGETGYFTETTPYDPRSPYSSSKASSDHLVMAYYHTYGLPITLSNCTNNYGPYQFPEKLIPLMIMNMKDGKNLPVYGDGKNIRDWIYVEDHNRAVWQIVNNGKIGEKYNIGGENEWENITLLHKLIELVSCELTSCKIQNRTQEDIAKTITHVTDRMGHDRRYAIDCIKIKTELGWQRKMTFEEGLQNTVKWYLDNPQWIENIKTGEYRK